MGPLRGGALPSIGETTFPLSFYHHYDGGPISARQGRSRTGRSLQRRCQVLCRRSGDTATDHDLRISHVAIDRTHTTAEEPATYFPLTELRRRAARGEIGPLAARFHGLPTNRSHRVTLDVDCPEIVARCKTDEVDAAVLVPNCPVCHQSVSLDALRMLEENGIATAVMGCAKDIVEYVGVPRFLFATSRSETRRAARGTRPLRLSPSISR